MTTHTPGPWEWEPGAQHILNSPSQSESGRMDTHSPVFMLSAKARRRLPEADARLIAAAPDLLEACKDAHRKLDMIYDARLNTPLTVGAEIDQLEAAIAKATGEAKDHPTEVG